VGPRGGPKGEIRHDRDIRCRSDTGRGGGGQTPRKNPKGGKNSEKRRDAARDKRGKRKCSRKRKGGLLVSRRQPIADASRCRPVKKKKAQDEEKWTGPRCGEDRRERCLRGEGRSSFVRRKGRGGQKGGEGESRPEQFVEGGGGRGRSLARERGLKKETTTQPGLEKGRKTMQMCLKREQRVDRYTKR